MENKSEKENEILDEAYKVSKEINSICDKNKEKEKNIENER